jgi:hypothetical protein
MLPAQLFTQVLESALTEIDARAIPVFTFALFHDHESKAISVCVDTEENSTKVVQGINVYNMKHFMEAVRTGDLTSASLWQANIGRSLSLGDFAMVNVARTALGNLEVNTQFYVAMVQAVMAKQEVIAAFSPSPERLVFACSGPQDEVALVWSMPANS